MARLIPCRLCKKEVSSTAKVCPHCGIAKPGQGQASGGMIAALVVAGVAAIAIVAGGQDGDAAPAQERSSEVYLSAAVRVTGTQVHIANRDTYPWTNCDVELNAGIVRGGWSVSGVSVAPGDTAVGGLRTFTSSDGARFNPGTHQAQTLDLHCDTPSGRRHWNGTLR